MADTNIAQEERFSRKKNLAGRKNWPDECLAVRPFAGVEWAHAAIMAGRPMAGQEKPKKNPLPLDEASDATH